MAASRIVDPFAWNGEYSIGVMALDTEHRNLFELIQELKTAVENDVDAQEQGALLHLLAENAAMHFASEEAMMAANRYSGLERNQSHCVPVIFVQGRRSLMVASTSVQCLRDAPSLVSL